MGFFGFCTKYSLPWRQVRNFALWLGKTRDSILPESEWLKLWDEFQK
jgi:hypothetical protein